MTPRSILSLLAVLALLTGCVAAPPKPVYLAPEAISAQSGRIGVAMATVPKVEMQFPGAGCLLCLMTASIANTSLTTHAKTLTNDELVSVKGDIANVLRKKGANVLVIDEEINVDELPDADGKDPKFARKNFSSLAKKYAIDKLLMIEINALGFIRSYSSYIPTTDPRTNLQGKGYLVNLQSNTYDWYLPVSVSKSADRGKWDEPPAFPGLTNAYFQTLEIGKDNLLQPFVKPLLPAAPVATAPAAATDAASSTEKTVTR